MTKCSHCELRAGLQGDGESDLALQVELSQVEHLLSQDLLFFHPPDAVQAEANSIVPKGILFHFGKLERLGEDGARPFLHARLGPLLLGRQQDQVDLPRDVACLFKSGNVGCCGYRDSQPLFAGVVLESDIQRAVLCERLGFVGRGELGTRTVLNAQRRKSLCNIWRLILKKSTFQMNR